MVHGALRQKTRDANSFLMNLEGFEGNEVKILSTDVFFPHEITVLKATL